MGRFLIMTVLLAAMLFSVACGNTESQEYQVSNSDATNQGQFEEKMDGGPNEGFGGPNGGRGGQGGRGGGMSNQSSEPDGELQAILDEVQDKYQLLTFTDPDTGFEMQYELFVPENYEDSERYPMIMFIPDSRAAGREPEFSLIIGWGGVIWAIAEEQAKPRALY